MPAAAIATLAIAGVLVAAVAFYLIWIAVVLTRINAALGKVESAVDAIAERTEPLNAAVRGINAALGRVASALADLLARRGTDRPHAGV